MLLCVHSNIAIILMGKRGLVALLDFNDLSSWCLVMVGWLFLVVPWGCLQFVIQVLTIFGLNLHTTVNGSISCYKNIKYIAIHITGVDSCLRSEKKKSTYIYLYSH